MGGTDKNTGKAGKPGKAGKAPKKTEILNKSLQGAATGAAVGAITGGAVGAAIGAAVGKVFGAIPQVNIKAETKQGFLEKLEGILRKMDEGLSTSAKIYEKSNKEITEELRAKERQKNASWLDALIIIGMTYQNDAEIKARFGRGKAEEVVENALETIEATKTVEKAIEAYLAGEYPNLSEKMLMAVEEFNKKRIYYKTHPVETTGEYLNEKGEKLLNGTPEEHGALSFDIVAMMIDMALTKGKVKEALDGTDDFIKILAKHLDNDSGNGNGTFNDKKVSGEIWNNTNAGDFVEYSRHLDGDSEIDQIKRVIFTDESDEHLTTVQGFDRKRTGIKGGHSKEAFDNFANTRPIRQVGETRYSEIEGLYEIDYQVAKLERGKPVPGEWVSGKIPYKKTLYDPNVIPDETMKQLARRALSDEKPFRTRGGQIKVQGETLYNEKVIRFEAWLDSDGVVKSYYPILEYSI